MAEERTAQPYICIRSNGVLFWLPAAGVTRILSGAQLRRARTEEDERTALLDGEPVRIWSMRALLGFPAGNKGRYALLLRAGGRLNGLMVDEVVEAADTAPRAASLPAVVLHEANRFLAGVVYMARQDTLAYLIDPDALLA